MTTSKTCATQPNFRRVLCAGGLVAVGLLAGCTPTDVPAQPATPSATTRPWVIDRLSSDEHSGKPLGGQYTAFCAPADAYSPAHVPDEDEFVEVRLTKADLAVLKPGDPCPADPEGKP